MTARTHQSYPRSTSFAESTGKDCRFRKGTNHQNKGAGRFMSIKLVSRNGSTRRSKAYAMWLKLKDSKLASSSPETIAAIWKEHAVFFREFQEAGL